MASSKSSFQSLGNGVYRVGGMHRSAVTGKFISNATAARHPRTTVVERGASSNGGDASTSR